MFIVPFIHKITTENNIHIHSISVLTIGGKTLWEEKASLHLDRDILNPNDIYRKGPPFSAEKSVQLCEVDTEKTHVHEFYKWNELSLSDTETFCWRTFLFLLGSKSESWLTSPKNEKLGHLDIGKLLAPILSRPN